MVVGLNVFSRNPISHPMEEDVAVHKDSFVNLQHLVLGNVNYDWDTVLKASQLWPQIKQFTASLLFILSF
jgi:hypothetical protein